ncbi:MAG: type III-A CRISPR-associated protein Cas10/Csm1, partial [Thermus sp.]
MDPAWLEETAVVTTRVGSSDPSTSPTPPRPRCVALADTYASQEREEGEGGGSPPEVPLLPATAQLRLMGQEGRKDLGLSPVHALGEGLVPGGPYPETQP